MPQQIKSTSTQGLIIASHRYLGGAGREESAPSGHAVEMALAVPVFARELNWRNCTRGSFLTSLDPCLHCRTGALDPTDSVVDRLFGVDTVTEENTARAGIIAGIQPLVSKRKGRSQKDRHLRLQFSSDKITFFNS